MMIELTLKDIQRQGLLILKDVHDFCQAHGIRYSMAYGTAIGAVRHHGFIPWDDDVDLFMPRPDYESLIKYFIDHHTNHILLSRVSVICSILFRKWQPHGVNMKPEYGLTFSP